MVFPPDESAMLGSNSQSMIDQPLQVRVTTAESQQQTLGNLNKIRFLAIHLPPFKSSDPIHWLSRLNWMFVESGVTVDETKFGYAMEFLDPSSAAELREIIINLPVHQPYQAFQVELIKRFNLMQDQKIIRILKHEEMGDRKPSEFLRYLRHLDGAALSEYLLRQLWIGHLPEDIQWILNTQLEDVPLYKVAGLADVIFDLSRPQPPQVVKVASHSLEALLDLKMAQLTVNLRQEIAAVVREEMEALGRFSWTMTGTMTGKL